MLAVVYLATAKLGLGLDPIGGFATLVWPPAGISVAALILFGPGLWPGVALGAFLANLDAGAPVHVAAAIALGNTGEALIGRGLILAVAHFTPSLARLRDVGALILAAALCPTVAALMGASSLVIGGVIPVSSFAATWTAWWMGDAIGILTFAPALLVWLHLGVGRMDLRLGAEVVALIVAILIVGGLVFRGPTGGGPAAWELYMLSPLLGWAALRFEQRGAVSTIVLVSAIAISATALGMGPFQGSLSERLRGLQLFMALNSVTFLLLAAVTAERRVAEERVVLARDEAQAANEAKSKFLTMMSHELRTPLTGIIGYAGLMAEGLSGPLTHTQEIQVGRIRSAAWQLVEIIDNILSFARGEAGRELTRTKPIDPVAIALEAWEVVEPLALTKGIELRLVRPETPFTIRSDPEKLRQILLNLLGNAVKFTGQGPIDVWFEGDGTRTELHVRDRGPGIPPDQLDRIFEPFVQLTEDESRTMGGTGLGLPVARALARALGGDLRVESKLGSGSTVILSLKSEELENLAPTPSLLQR